MCCCCYRCRQNKKKEKTPPEAAPNQGIQYDEVREHLEAKSVDRMQSRIVTSLFGSSAKRKSIRRARCARTNPNEMMSSGQQKTTAVHPTRSMRSRYDVHIGAQSQSVSEMINCIRRKVDIVDGTCRKFATMAHAEKTRK